MFGTSFDHYLNNLSKVLQRSEDMNLALNWEKHHFMRQKRVILGHVISNKGVDVDEANVEVIEKLAEPLV